MWLWKLLEEKAWNSQFLDWYTDLHERNVIRQELKNEIVFSVHPTLFFPQYTWAQGVLSGSLQLDGVSFFDMGKSQGSYSWEIHLILAWINDRSTNTINQLSLNDGSVEKTSWEIRSFESTINFEVMKFKNDYYLYLTDINFITEEDSWLVTFRGRYILLKQYQQKWIHLTQQDASSLKLLFPDYFAQLLDENNKKSRIVPDPSDGWIYLLSWDSLMVTGQITHQQPETIAITLPNQKIRIAGVESNTSNLYTVAAHQYSPYKGSFDGIAQVVNSRKLHALNLSGALLWPKGIRWDLELWVSQKKVPSLTVTFEQPEQYIEWTKIQESRNQYLPQQKEATMRVY